jgi:SM-20-related protein
MPRDDAPALLAVEQGLRSRGFAIVQDLFAGDLVLALAKEAAELAGSGALRPAAVGRSGGERHLPALRGDVIQWLEPRGDAGPIDRFLAACDDLREQLNRRLLLGMRSLEAHIAWYPPGAGYRRHRDTFRDDDSRVLSLTCYLNPAWTPDDGGALRLHLPEGPLDVLPLLGTSVLFLSAEIEHEVLPARRPRASLAAWFRKRPVGNALPA